VAELINKAQLAAHYGVSVHAVNDWRKKGLPAAEKRARAGALLFDIPDVDVWLVNQGIVPGGRSLAGRRMGGESAPAGAAADVRRAPLIPDGPIGDQTLEGTVARLLCAEKMLAEVVMHPTDPLGAVGATKRWTDVVNQLRQAARNLREEQEAQSKLISGELHAQQMCDLAALLKGAALQWPVEVGHDVCAALAQAGLETGSSAAFQRQLFQALEAAVDRMLASLSAKVRALRVGAEPVGSAAAPLVVKGGADGPAGG